MAKKPNPADALKALVDSAGGSGSGDFDLGAAAGAQFDTSGMFGGTMSGTDVLNAFIAAGSPGGKNDIASAIQHALYYSGLGGPDYMPEYGIITKSDVTAFANTLKLLAAANTQRPDGITTPLSLGGYLKGQVALAVGSGQSSALLKAQAAAARQVNTVPLPNSADLGAAADEAFRAALGRKATAAEKQAFAVAYKGIYKQAVEKAQADVTNAASVPDTAPTAEPTAAPAPAPAGRPPGTPPRPGDADFMGPVLPPKPGDPNFMGPVLPSFADGINSLTDALAGSSNTRDLAPATVYTESAPNVGVAAANYARNTNPQEAGAHDIAGAFDTFLSLIGAGGH